MLGGTEGEPPPRFNVFVVDVHLIRIKWPLLTSTKISAALMPLAGSAGFLTVGSVSFMGGSKRGVGSAVRQGG